jgi:hypothetical protein
MCDQDGHKFKTTQHREPYTSNRLMWWVAYRR